MPVYKACVESELTSIIKEIAALRDAPEDDHFIALQHKQKLANREVKLECLKLILKKKDLKIYDML